jgi:hypothetical protein
MLRKLNSLTIGTEARRRWDRTLCLGSIGIKKALLRFSLPRSFVGRTLLRFSLPRSFVGRTLYKNRLLLKALPEPDFKYFSKAKALYLSENAI